MRSSPGLNRPIHGRVLAVNRGRGRAECHGFGRVGADVWIPDVDNNHTDVVRSSGLFGQGDELVYGVGRIRRGRQDGADSLVAYDRAQAIRTDQVAVSGPQLAEAQIRGSIRATVEVPREHRRQGTSIRDKIAKDVIFGDLAQPTVP